MVMDLCHGDLSDVYMILYLYSNYHTILTYKKILLDHKRPKDIHKKWRCQNIYENDLIWSRAYAFAFHPP